MEFHKLGEVLLEFSEFLVYKLHGSKKVLLETEPIGRCPEKNKQLTGNPV